MFEAYDQQRRTYCFATRWKDSDRSLCVSVRKRSPAWNQFETVLNLTFKRLVPATSSGISQPVSCSWGCTTASYHPAPTLPWKRHASDKVFQQVNTNIPQHQSYSINTATAHPGLIWKPMGFSSPQWENKSRKMLFPCLIQRSPPGYRHRHHLATAEENRQGLCWLLPFNKSMSNLTYIREDHFQLFPLGDSCTCWLIFVRNLLIQRPSRASQAGPRHRKLLKHNQPKFSSPNDQVPATAITSQTSCVWNTKSWIPSGGRKM